MLQKAQMTTGSENATENTITYNLDSSPYDIAILQELTSSIKIFSRDGTVTLTATASNNVTATSTITVSN